jgi:SAM-dependent methyltransferase
VTGASDAAPAGRPAARPTRCTLCGIVVRTAILETPERTYLHCARCTLIFLHPDDRLLPLQEVLRYLEHRNDGADPGYVQFLRRLADPVCDAVPLGAIGLDFGCGPAPVLAGLLTARGRPTESYDPLFRAERRLLARQYDFVTCCEVMEHAHEPAGLLGQLSALLSPGGTLAVMTRFYGLDGPFDRWWYRRDTSHVSFFSAETMRWIATQRGWRLQLPAPHVAIFHAP